MRLYLSYLSPDESSSRPGRAICVAASLTVWLLVLEVSLVWVSLDSWTFGLLPPSTKPAAAVRAEAVAAAAPRLAMLLSAGCGVWLLAWW
jgi:hypothetical protein